MFYALTNTLGYPNYGWAIILFTIALRVLMFPLNLMQAKSTRAMGIIQPRIKKLQEQYKNDPAILHRETQALYRKYKVNPLSGCLPLLVQMPILFALFSALRNFEYVGGSSFYWLKSLTEPDPTFVLPIVVGLSSYLQSKVTIASQPAAANETAKMMNYVTLYGMPVMLAFMSNNFVAGLAIYWSVFNVLGFLMQMLINMSVSRAQEGLAAKVEADEKQAEIDEKKEELRRKNREAERKRAIAARRKTQPKSPVKQRADNNEKGKPLDFDD